MQERYRPNIIRNRAGRVVLILVAVGLAGFGIAYAADVLAEKTAGGKKVIEKIVETPTPSEAPGTPRPTPRAGKTIPAQAGRIPVIFHGLKPGESFEAPAGSIVVGDVAVNGRALFDSRQETGLIVDLREGARIDAPFGADVQTDIDPAKRKQILRNNKKIMRQSGCVDGCAVVDVVVFPGGDPQGQN